MQAIKVKLNVELAIILEESNLNYIMKLDECLTYI